MNIGVLSDTHGLLRPEVRAAFAGVDHILHAGDVGDPAILEALRTLAPVTAIRGNIDKTGPCAALPAEEYIPLAGLNLYMLHDVQTLSIAPAAAGIAAVIFGHTHKPLIEERKGVLFFNPGASGQRRFRLPISVGFLRIEHGRITPELLTLSAPSDPA
ncbi:metallophosphoesterase family protein [Acidipila sp. EB88]|uniref:metallophosphoesterase family protein n=1 Tax=Acidipila sp. EB88 TaxID=2305226 RepID=UPI000F5E3F3F|nr:metallophosphoesterase family protein [Acidipila sp. EB88]RRA49082.1 metallophosphoesterase [Acidipila sp. EB88]